MERSIILFSVAYGITVIIAIYLIKALITSSKEIKSEAKMREAKPWPWPITKYNEWPYWYVGGGNGGYL
jgi:hypothetical protein